MNETSETRMFFISYNHRDSAWAEWIAWQLEDSGYSTIIQAWDFAASSNFVLDMDQGLKKAERVIAVLSPNYFESRFTPAEWASALAQDPTGEKKKLVPVRVKEVRLEGLLSAIIYIDLVGKDESAAKHELLSRLTGERTKPRCAPVFPGKPKPTFPGLDEERVQAEVKFTAVITGTVTAEHKALLEAIVAHLRKVSGDASLTLLEVRKGSVVLVMRCSRAGFERLQLLHENGQLKKIFDFEVKELKTCDEADIRDSTGDTRDAVSAWIVVLTGNNRDAREEAIRELKSHSGVAVPALIHALQRDRNAIVRVSAAEALGEIGPTAEDAVAALAGALQQDNSTLVCAAVLEALGRIGQAAMPALVQALQRDQREQVRRTAAEMLGRIGPESVPILVRALREDDSEAIRSAAAHALKGIGTAAVPVLIDTLRVDQNTLVRSAALRALGGIGTATVDALVEASKWDKSEEVRIAAIETLRRDTATAVLPALIETLRSDESEEIRIAANKTLRAIWITAMPALVEVWMPHRSEQVRMAAAETLRSVGATVVNSLGEVLHRDDNEQVRCAVAEALGEVGREGGKSLGRIAIEPRAAFGPAAPEAAVSSLIQGLRLDESARVRDAVFKALVTIGTVAIPPLIQMLKLDARGEMRRDAAAALGGIVSKEVYEARGRVASPIGEAAVPPLVQRLQQDDNHEVRYAAVQALGQCGPAGFGEAVPALVQLLRRDESDEMRRAAVQALGNIIGTEAVDAQGRTPPIGEAMPDLVRMLQQDKSEQVRGAAAAALGQIVSANARVPGAQVPIPINEVVSGFVRVLQSDNSALVRWSVAEMLGRIGPAAIDAVPALTQAQQHDEDERVRYAAGEALKRIEPDADRGISVRPNPILK